MKRPLAGWVLSEPSAPFDVRKASALDRPEQLAALHPPVQRSLAATLGVQALADRLCPVERADGSVTLLARADYVGSDQAEALSRAILASGRHLSEPARYVLPAAMLLALSRAPADAPLAGVLRARAGVGRTSTALAGVFQDLLSWGVRHGATDLHLNVLRDRPVSEVRYTVAGRYVAPARFRHMPTDLLMDVLAVAWMDIQGGNGAVFDPRLEQQGSLVKRMDGRDFVLRWASLASDRGPSVCLRLLERDAARETATLEALGYRPDQVAQFDRVLCAEGGAVVLAGTVGSGKSTTLAALIRRLPAHRKVITLEEPVEYRIERAVQNSIQRDLSTDATDDYAIKLRALKRSAMSDVLLGEVRDPESGLAFLDLVSSGVNLYTTLHAPSARAIPERLSSRFIGVPRDFLDTPGTLKLLVYQALLPQLCPGCALPLTEAVLARDTSRTQSAWARWLGWLQAAWPLETDGLRARNPAGCARCCQPQLPALSGYAGRTVAAELVEPGLTRADPSPTSAFLPDPHHSALAHAMQKVAQGLIDPRDVEPRFAAFETLALRRRAS